MHPAPDVDPGAAWRDLRAGTARMRELLARLSSQSARLLVLADQLAAARESLVAASLRLQAVADQLAAAAAAARATGEGDGRHPSDR